jgi:capsule biosynthesis phosphatase
MYKDYTFIFDIDGTLCPIKKKDEEYADLVPYGDMVEKIRYYKDKGAKIILYTSRNMNSYEGNIGLINKNTAPVLMGWLEKWDIPYDEIVYGKLWPGHKGFYVDDRTVRPDEFLNAPVEELERICEASRCKSGESPETPGDGKGASDKASGGKAAAYVDGSYDVETGNYSYGAVIFFDGRQEEFSERFDDEEMASMRNVAGEIEGSKKAMSYCLENGISELDLFFDYEGIRAWCTGQWKTNKEGTKAYKAFYDEAAKKLKVNFIKVKSHSGVEFNERADKLAKQALS